MSLQGIAREIVLEDPEHPVPRMTVYETQTDRPIKIEAVDLAHYLAQTLERYDIKPQEYNAEGQPIKTPLYSIQPIGDEGRMALNIPPPLLSSSHPDYQMPPEIAAELEILEKEQQQGMIDGDALTQQIVSGVSQAITPAMNSIAESLKLLAERNNNG